MFGIGLPELILILAIGLIVLGPQKLPEVAKTLGKMLVEFKKAANSFKEGIDLEAQNTKISQDEQMPVKIPSPVSQPKVTAVNDAGLRTNHIRTAADSPHTAPKDTES